MQDYKMPERQQQSHKGTFGKVLNVAGSENYTGAAYLSSLAVLKIGAGYVALASSDKINNKVSQMLPEAVYISRKKALKTIDQYNVVLLGCGLGTKWGATDDFLKIVVKMQNSEAPLVIDADGLNILSRFKNRLKLPQNTIITPHPLEASRLLGVEPYVVLSDLEDCAKKLSEVYSCTVILKNHRTVICSDGNIYVNQNGNSALAKAGTGDVLAGIVAGLLAQKMSIYEASKLGVYLHSRAGELASDKLSQYSVLASDVIKYLPSAIKEIL